MKIKENALNFVSNQPGEDQLFSLKSAPSANLEATRNNNKYINFFIQ
jgi:hypothetical protein